MAAIAPIADASLVVKVLRANKTLISAVRQRHPWVFRDALPKIEGLKLAAPVRVLDKKGNYLGDGLFEPSGEIAVRFWNFSSRPVGASELVNTVQKAIQRRQNFRDFLRTDALRLVHGESDGAPGLIIDSYAGHVVMQFHSEATRAAIMPLIPKILPLAQVKSLSIKETSSQGGELQIVSGVLPVEVVIREGECSYIANIYDGQKTGFYLDLRSARLMLPQLVRPGCHFLNLFGYTGAFTLQALKAGATQTVTVDQSMQALAMLKKQAHLNGFTSSDLTTASSPGGGVSSMMIRAEDVRDVLKDLARRKQEFDVVICDPPSFIHNKAQKSKGWDAYQSLYAQALGAVKEGGVIGIGNCSAQIAPSEFELLTEQASLDAKVQLFRIFDVGQPPDHPIRVGFPEGRYLNFQYFTVSRL